MLFDHVNECIVSFICMFIVLFVVSFSFFFFVVHFEKFFKSVMTFILPKRSCKDIRNNNCIFGAYGRNINYLVACCNVVAWFQKLRGGDLIIVV